MIPLLMNSDSLSAGARAALRAVVKAPPSLRAEARQEAARILYQETGLECAEVKDLVGLDRDEACSA